MLTEIKVAYERPLADEYRLQRLGFVNRRDGVWNLVTDRPGYMAALVRKFVGNIRQTVEIPPVGSHKLPILTVLYPKEKQC